MPGQSTHLSVVLDLGLGAARAQRGHAAVLEGERDHLAALAHWQHLQNSSSSPSLPLQQPLGAQELQQHQRVHSVRVSPLPPPGALGFVPPLPALLQPSGLTALWFSWLLS